MTNNPDYFERQLADLVIDFKRGVMDERKCESLARDAKDIEESIIKSLTSRNEFTSNEKSQLKKLKEEASALEYYIASLTTNRSYILDIDRFYIANRMVGGKLINIIKNEYCMDIISLTIKDFVVYIVMNPTQTLYSIDCKWELLYGINSGSI